MAIVTFFFATTSRQDLWPSFGVLYSAEGPATKPLEPFPGTPGLDVYFGKKVQLSLQQAMEAHKIARCRSFQIF
jgi:hypothetical protein